MYLIFTVVHGDIGFQVVLSARVKLSLDELSRRQTDLDFSEAEVWRVEIGRL